MLAETTVSFGQGQSPGPIGAGKRQRKEEREWASVTTEADTIVEVDWRGHRRYMFFQDGTIFRLRSCASEVIVLARYASNGEVAALVAPFGRGRVGVCGPHPEAPEEWYRAHNLVNPHGISPDLGHDLIDTLMQ